MGTFNDPCWDVQKIPEVWQPFRNSARPGFTALPAASPPGPTEKAWTKLWDISMNQMLDLLAS